MNIYEATVRYERAGEKGLNTKVVEQYIIETKSCAAAENGLLEMLKSQVTGGVCEVLSIKRSAVNETVGCDTCLDNDFQRAIEDAFPIGDQRYYKAKVAFDLIDELTGKVKKLNKFYFISAASVEGAHMKLKYYLNASVMDYEVLALSETKFIDYVHITEDGEAVVV